MTEEQSKKPAKCEWCDEPSVDLGLCDYHLDEWIVDEYEPDDYWPDFHDDPEWRY